MTKPKRTPGINEASACFKALCDGDIITPEAMSTIERTLRVAPKMLTALKGAAPMLGSFARWRSEEARVRKLANALIAEAEGRTD